MTRVIPALGCLVLLSYPALASAHIRMTSPAPRYPEDSLKEGPCGVEGGQRGDQVTVVRAGSVLRVEWDETVPHDSHYRISFDDDGDDDFADPPEMMAFDSNQAVLIDGIANTGGHMTVDVPLPNRECTRCTLQLIQVMYDKPPYEVGGNDIYYQCADLELRADAPCADGIDGGAGDGGVCNSLPIGNGVDGGSSGGGSSGDGGTGDGDSTSGGGGYYGGGSEGASDGTPPAAADRATTTTGTVCAVHHGRSAAGALGWLALVGGAFVIRRRRPG